MTTNLSNKIISNILLSIISIIKTVQPFLTYIRVITDFNIQILCTYASAAETHKKKNTDHRHRNNTSRVDIRILNRM